MFLPAMYSRVPAPTLRVTAIVQSRYVYVCVLDVVYDGQALCNSRVLSRKEFMGGKMVRGKCALGRGLGPFPQESVSVPLSEHIYSSVSTGRQELSQCHYFKLQLGKPLGGEEAGVFGGKAPPSRLNPE